MNETELATAMSGERTSRQLDAFEIRCRIGAGYAGLSPRGAPTFLFVIEEGPQPTGRLLGQVRTSFYPRVNFVFREKSWSQPAAVLECLDRALLRTFCCLGTDLARRLTAPITARQILAALRSWDELLRKRDQLSPRRELGLWGELTLLMALPEPERGLAAWYGADGHTMDFHGGGVAIECKTSVHRRRHRVSLEQARHTGSLVETYLASLWAQEDSTTGQTIGELARDAAVKVSDPVPLRKKLLQVGFREDHEYTARYSLVEPPKLFPMNQIPKVRAWDPDVSKISYEVDLSRIAPLDDDACRATLEKLCTEKKDD